MGSAPDADRAAADPLARALVIFVCAVSLAGLVAELGDFLLGWPARPVELFALSYESNVPTWVSSSLLLLASVALARSAEQAATHRVAWWSLAAIFAFLSLDESIEIHEHLSGLVRGHGVLYFSWVIPAAVLVGALGLTLLPFLRDLEPIDRRRFVTAGALYVGGALVMELPLGWWAERAGDENLTYGLIDWVEESLELAGATMFLLALRARLTRTAAAR